MLELCRIWTAEWGEQHCSSQLMLSREEFEMVHQLTKELENEAQWSKISHAPPIPTKATHMTTKNYTLVL